MQVESKYRQAEKEMIEEYALIEAAKTDPGKFAPLYNTYYEKIFRFIYQRIDDKELAFDTTSQVFLKAMLNLQKYKFKGLPFSSWLYRIASNELTDLFRSHRAKRTVKIDSVNVYNIIAEVEENSLEIYHDELITAITKLPEEDLRLIEMRFFEKRTFKEIGDILEITENNAKVKTYRTLEKLKKILTPKEWSERTPSEKPTTKNS